MCETIELDDATLALQNLDFVALRRSAPLCAGDVCVIKSEGLSASNWLPTEAGFSESESARLLRQVQVDIIEILPVIRSACAPRSQAPGGIECIAKTSPGAVGQ